MVKTLMTQEGRSGVCGSAERAKEEAQCTRLACALRVCEKEGLLTLVLYLVHQVHAPRVTFIM